jgi:hypothetical protein
MLGAEALPRTEVIKHITSLLQDKNSRSNEILASHTYDYELQRQGCKEITIQEVPLCFEKNYIHVFGKAETMRLGTYAESLSLGRFLTLVVTECAQAPTLARRE